MEDNPYRAPNFDETFPKEDVSNYGLGASDLTEAEIRAFVGKKAEYYLANWSSVLHHGGRRTGFNWAAFFLCGLWIPYRKMYRIAWILFGMLTLEIALEAVAAAYGLWNERASAALDRIAGIAVPFVCGRYGNAWYLAHTKRQIARVRRLDLGHDLYYETLAQRGRTSLLGSIGLFFIFILAMFVISAAREIFVSGD